MLLVAACGGDTTEQARVECGAPQLASSSAGPLDWVEVSGLPAGLGAAVAEIRSTGPGAAGEGTVLSTVRRRADGSAALRVSIHPSLPLEGGETTVRIYSDTASCDPVPLTITGLEPAPGAMEEAARELRTTVDEIIAPTVGDGELPVMAIPALWVLPELERLEGLLASDALAAGSSADAEVLDAIAGRLELAERMREFRELVLVTHELIGDLSVTVPPAPEARASRRPVGANRGFQFAAYRPTPHTARRQSGSCLEDRVNLFDIAEPAELDNLMRAQDYAERFLAGATDQEGGSASGTVFGDIGVVVGWIEFAGKAGEVAAEVWDAFSTVVLNTMEAYAKLLPDEMELTVTADPPEFEEDSEETGTWTASAVAASEGMKLTQKVIEKVMNVALEKALADASIGRELTGKAPDDSELSNQIDEQLLKNSTSAALDALLDAIGAKEVEGGFDIPGGCWTLGDMSGSDEPDQDATSSAPPLVTPHLSGGAVEWTGNGSGVPREYEPVEAGTSRLEIRTAEGYRKAIEVPLGAGFKTDIAATYAFGGDQYTAVTRITVNEIEVQISPSLIRVEPGERVPFVATVQNAVDTRVRWSRSAGSFVQKVDFGDGTHEAVLITPKSPKLFPITVEVESISRSGPRADGIPVRKATALIQLADPVIDIQPPGGCIRPGDERQFVAHVWGVKNQEVTWAARGPSGGTIHRQNGLFRAGSRNGTYTIRAAWAEDPEVASEVELTVKEDCVGWVTYSGAINASYPLSGDPPPHFDPAHGAEPYPDACLGWVMLRPETPEGRDQLVLGGGLPVPPRVGPYPVVNYWEHRWKGTRQPPPPVGTLGFQARLARVGREDGRLLIYESRGGVFEIVHVDADVLHGRFDVPAARVTELGPGGEPILEEMRFEGFFVATLPQMEDDHPCRPSTTPDG